MKIIATDLEFFRLIATAGCCNLEQARKIYEPVSNNQWYHYKRVQRLTSEGFVLKRNQIIELSLRGAELIGETKYRFRNPESRKNHAQIADLILSTNFRFVSSREVRRQYNINRITYFKGGLEINDKLYLLYIINNDITATYLKKMQAELIANGTLKLDRSIILFKEPVMIGFFDVDPFMQQELIMLPYSAGIQFIDKYFKEEFQSILYEKIPKVAKPSTCLFADYETSEEYYTFLVLHDLVKQKALENYIKSPFQIPINIICLESQIYLYLHLFPKVNFKIIENYNY